MSFFRRVEVDSRENETMASRQARWPNQEIPDRGQIRSGTGRGGVRVEDILRLCPESMGGKTTYDAIGDRDRTMKAAAVGRIKALLTQVKDNIKVCMPWS